MATLKGQNFRICIYDETAENPKWLIKRTAGRSYYTIKDSASNNLISVNIAELNNKSATCVVNELTFEKIGSIQTPPAGGGDVPETPTPDLNAPTTGAGYCDTGYSITTSNNEFVIKFAIAPVTTAVV